MLKQLNWKLIGGGLAVYAVGVGATYQYFHKAEAPPSNKQRCQHWKTFSDYDQRVDRDERANGIIKKRMELLCSAKGFVHRRVLEIGMGTGRNLDYYPTNCDVTGVDISASMLEVAKGKASNLNGFSCQTSDVHQLSFPDDSFDTVVDTFGLCSYDKPEQVISEMCRVCGKNGTILLLEHGHCTPSYFGTLMNWYLDKRATTHANKWGCWWNRDITKIVEKAIENANTEKQGKYSKFTIVDYHTMHFGTTHAFKIENTNNS